MRGVARMKKIAKAKKKSGRKIQGGNLRGLGVNVAIILGGIVRKWFLNV
jgi:hypothetical protein